MRSASDKTAAEAATREEPERLARGQQAWRRDFAVAAIASAQAREELIPALGDPVQRPAATGAGAPQGIELRHLRYFVTLADAGSFTHAAERIFVAQPTLSQQIRRLEEILGTPLLQRRREGLKLTAAGRVLLDASRNVLALVDHTVSRTRQAAGVGRQRLRMVIPPCLPESLAVAAAARLRAAAAAAEVDVAWLETALDPEFSLIGSRRADAGLGWLTAAPEALPAPLEAMVLEEFEPQVWVRSSHAAAHRGTISLDELARMAVIHGPCRAQAGTYDAWSTVVRTVDPRFAFTDPPFQRSLLLTLAFAATADRPTAVLTGPAAVAGSWARPIRRSRPAGTCGMVAVSLKDHPLTASAAPVWSGDLPRPPQQLLFETADSLTAPASPRSRRTGRADHRLTRVASACRPQMVNDVRRLSETGPNVARRTMAKFSMVALEDQGVLIARSSPALSSVSPARDGDRRS